MAEEKTETTEENPPEETTERREERREERTERQEPRTSAREADTVECSKCGALVRPASLGTHMFAAHQVERRAKPKRDDDQGDDKQPPTPTRKDSPRTDEKGPQSAGTGKSKGRWASVRKGWG